MSKLQQEFNERVRRAIINSPEGVEEAIREKMKGEWQAEAKKHAYNVLVEDLKDLYPFSDVIEVPEGALEYGLNGELLGIRSERITVWQEPDIDFIHDLDADIWDMDSYDEDEQLEDMLDEEESDIKMDVHKILNPEIDLKVRVV